MILVFVVWMIPHERYSVLRLEMTGLASALHGQRDRERCPLLP